MKKLKRLSFLGLSIMFCGLLLIFFGTSLQNFVNAESGNSLGNYEDINTYVDNLYTKYLDEKTKAHQETHGEASLYPTIDDIYINSDNYNQDKSTIESIATIKVSDYFYDDPTTTEIENDQLYKDAKNENVIRQADNGTLTFEVVIPQSGFYNIDMRYYTEIGYSSSIERSLAINGVVPFDGADALTFSRVWIDNPSSYDENGNLKQDTKHNEMKPKQIENHVFREMTFKDYMGYITSPYKFYLEEGTNYLSLISIKEPVVIDYLKIHSVDETPTYKDYINDLLASTPNNNLTNQSTKWQAEKTTAKSSPTLYPVTDRSSSKTEPSSHTKTCLNVIGGNNWKVLGDWIEWEFTVPESGYYNISMRAKQNMVRGMYSSRIVYVDGNILFEELNDVQFSYANKWTNVTLGDQEGDYLFYFDAKDEKGNAITHTLRMEVTLGAYASLIERIQEVINDLSAMYRKIISYTTVTPDAGRDYQLNERFPTMKEEFRSYADELIAISNEITRISGSKSDKTGVIDSVVVQLEGFLKDNLRTIPERLSTFNNNISSLGTLLNSLRELPLMIDYIQVHTPDVKLDKANEGFFTKLWNGIVSFFVSFFIDYSAIGETQENITANNGSIEVWMTQGRDQANVIRNLIDTDFTKKTGIKVDLKLTGADVLLKATLAGIGPDVALNVDSSLPVNYALRNAVLDLSQFIYELDDKGAIIYEDAILYNEDGTVKKDGTGNIITKSVPKVKDKDFAFVWDGETYNEAIVRRYAEINGLKGKNTKSVNDIKETEIPNNFYMESSLSQFQFYYDTTDYRNTTTGTYALPEKQIFLMMFVRDDVMDEHGLGEIYDWDNMTWPDVIDLIAELQTYQLQFYLPVNDSGATALNPIFITLLYQKQGQLYINGNKETGLKSSAAMDAFEQWTEFYTLYSFPKSASFVNRFRTGEMPIGISYYEMYNTLSVFAPELKGKWSFHLIPGTVLPDGTVDHTATASGSGCVILKQPADKDAQVKANSWEFVKWWSSYSTQVSFGREMEGILGSAARHATANVKALNSLAWPKADLEKLMEQWEKSAMIPQIAGSYITGREMENAYRQVINNLYNPREVLFEYAEKINNEIDRKRDEFSLDLRK